MTLHRAHLRVLIAVAIAAGLLISPAAARGEDSVTAWSRIAAEALLPPPSPPSPPGQGGAGQGAAGVAHLAMVHGAVFDAVNSIDRRYEPYLVQLPARRWYSRDAAVAAAAHRVLISGHVVRDDDAVDQQTPLVAKVEPLYAAALAAIPDGPAKSRGIATGEAAAWMMIAERTGDRRFEPPQGGFDLRPPGPGVWQPKPPEASVNDPGAWLKDTTPFLLRHPKRFAAQGPLPLTSTRYAEELNEVKAVGEFNSVRTEEQTAAAKFWGGPTNAVLTWTGMIRTLAGLRPQSTVDSARFYALVYLTAADALIVTWTDKQKWMSWRPNAAIRGADTDGNPATEADADWTPLIGNPPYPEHPSGLATLGAVNAATLRELFGTDEVAFEASNSLGAKRTYGTLSQVAHEILDARVWSGIHFRSSDEQGAKIGRDVARWRRHHGFLQPRR